MTLRLIINNDKQPSELDRVHPIQGEAAIHEVCLSCGELEFVVVEGLLRCATCDEYNGIVTRRKNDEL